MHEIDHESYLRIRRAVTAPSSGLDASDVAALMARIPKPARDHVRSIVDVEEPSTTTLLVATGLPMTFGGQLPPLLDPDGFRLTLGVVNWLAPEQLAVIEDAHERRLDSIAGVGGIGMLGASWRDALTPWAVVKSPAAFDLRDVFRAMTETMSRTNLLHEESRAEVPANAIPAPLFNLALRAAEADPIAAIAWADRERERARFALLAQSVSTAFAPDGEPLSELERLILRIAADALNRGDGPPVIDPRTREKRRESTTIASESRRFAGVLKKIAALQPEISPPPPDAVVVTAPTQTPDESLANIIANAITTHAASTAAKVTP